MNEFEKGTIYAVVQILKHDEPTMASYILIESGCTKLDCSELDEFDKKYLRCLQDEKGINLRGLN